MTETISDESINCNTFSVNYINVHLGLSTNYSRYKWKFEKYIIRIIAQVNDIVLVRIRFLSKNTILSFVADDHHETK